MLAPKDRNELELADSVSSRRNRWASLDCLKGISCLAVVIIHYNLTGGNIPVQVGQAMKSACRFAVPVFLCISGFFALEENGIDSVKCIHRINSTIKLLLTAVLFYAVFSCIWYPLMNADWTVSAFLKDTITGTKVVKLFLTHDPFVYSHLWYLLALISCYLLILLYPKCTRAIYFLAPILLIAYSCMQEFKIVVSSIQISDMTSRIYLYNSFLFRALPFFLFGMIFRKQLTNIQALPICKAALIFAAVLGCICAIFEFQFFGDCQFFIGSYITVFAMFVYALKYPNASQPVLHHIGKDLSAYIYLFHIAVGKMMDAIGKYGGFWGKDAWYVIRPFAIFIISIAFAEGIFRMRRLTFRKK